MTPIITVVTVCYNSEKTIKKTIESVLEQDLCNIEYLIIDGASTDSTVDVINSFKDRFCGKMKVVSEPDNGWYDAMNKGIRNAKGDFIVFLNSDDYFDKDALKIIKNKIKKTSIGVESIVYGDSTNIYMNSKGEKIYRRIKAPDCIDMNDPRLRDGMCGVRHQSMFTGKEVFKKIGELDLQYRLHADWDFLVKCVKRGVPMYYIPKNITFYSMYGVSTNPNYQERHLLRKNNRLYRTVDFKYLKDRFGAKTIARRLLGVKRWNDFLFYIHRIGEKW